ncbi:ETS-related transcription factor Elf-3 [Ambystoma mexicanum]|uniref:ETS-related transcription factor Elf-3 n=1 Tax=Ambystoma mexicanum TaxID=8296 RepID=UPI0037E79FD8
MASSCEISNLISTYANTMYMQDPEPLFYEGDNLLPLPATDLPFEILEKSNWSSVLPLLWNEQHVLEWISFHVEQNKCDASTIDFSHCKMDGNSLCQLTRDDLLAWFGPLGEKLYNHLCELTSYWKQLMFDIIPPDLQFDNLQDNYNYSSDGEFTYSKPALTDLTLWDKENFFLAHSPHSDGCSSSVTLNSPESISFEGSGSGSESDLERSDSQSDLSLNASMNISESNLQQQKRKRGRPRKISKENRDCLDSKRSKHSARGSHLWEFIRDILIHPELNEGLMKWEDRSEGIFKFLRSEAVAQLWGQKKKNTSMTYEKLSRAMRYYYKREILERVDGRRLVYKFGKNSSGWKEEETLCHQS